jgi:ribosomal-protein-alanine N-acetyltransferase
MRVPFLTLRRDHSIEPLAPEDGHRLAHLHIQDFARPWSSEEFSALIEQNAVFGFKAVEIGNSKAAPAGFVLARQAAGEAEILTIAVARTLRRRGLGRQLMDAVLRRLHAERTESLFLEVDETNAPAIALYRRLGFHEVGRRSAYYRSAEGIKTDALVMRRDLR